MTLEEMQDAKAYPAKVYRKEISEDAFINGMKALAAIENKANRSLRNAAIAPSGPGRSAFQASLFERVAEAMRPGKEYTAEEMGQRMNVTTTTARQYMNTVVQLGIVTKQQHSQGRDTFTINEDMD